MSENDQEACETCAKLFLALKEGNPDWAERYLMELEDENPALAARVQELIDEADPPSNNSN
jgi:hypothetical protein